MRLLWLTHLLPYPATGLGVLQRSHNLVKELARDHDVDVLGFVQPGALRAVGMDPDTGLEQGRLWLETICDRVGLLPLPFTLRMLGQQRLAMRSLFSRDPYTINWLKSPTMEERVREFCRTRRYDVVHFDTISLAPYLAQASGQLTVLNHHNIESHMMLRRAKNEGNVLRRAYYAQEGMRLESYERRNCGRFDLNLTCSATDTARLKRLIPESEVIEVPNGVDIDYFQGLRMQRDERTLVFAGNMSWYPNAAAMKFFVGEVWPRLRASVPDASMWILGASPPAAIQSVAIDDTQLHVEGFVDDVRPYLDRATAYVCPIMDGGGTKLKILDALSMGVPLVAHPIACEGIDVVDGESVIFAKTPEEFVRAVEKVFADRKLAHRLGVSGRALVEERYSFRKIAQGLSFTLDDMLKRSEGRATGPGLEPERMRCS